MRPFFEQYREWRAQGLSERQAAQELKGPSTPLQAWRGWHDTLDICHHVAEFLQSGPGLAFFHRLVMAFHLVCVAIGAWGLRLGCLFLHLSGLDRFVAASYGAQQQVNLQVAQAIVAYGHTEPPRLAKDMPPKDLTGTQDETFPGGLYRITRDPESNFLLLEQLAQARDQTTWHDLRAPALAQRNGRVIPATSDAAPGLLASVEHSLEAHHSPDFCQVQHELVNAVSGPMATTARAAHKAVTEATEPLDRLQSAPPSAGDEPAKRHPSRHPQDLTSLEQAEPALDAARREHERLAAQREQGKASLRGIGDDDHCVDLERGVRRNGQRIASDIQAHIEQIRTMAQHEGLRQPCLERIEKAERVVPNMQATIEFVSGYVKQQGAQLALTPPVSLAMHAKLMPSYDLDRVAGTRPRSDGAPLRERAERLRASVVEPGGV